MILKYQEGTLQRLPGQTLSESLEIYIMNELAEARDGAGIAADEDFGFGEGREFLINSIAYT